MIYIKRHNLCFIRIPKNASSSVMHFLYHNFCNDEDTVSRMYEWNHDRIEKLYYKNCPKLPHSHVDYRYVVEAGIVPDSATFIGVIREPLERVLSLYLYRVRDGEYGTIVPSPEHFQSLFNDGVFNDTPQQVQAQHTFVPDNSKLWLYENIDMHLDDLCKEYDVDVKTPLMRLNKSPGNTQQLIKIFFNERLIEEFKLKYAKDFVLYNELKEQHHVST